MKPVIKYPRFGDMDASFSEWAGSKIAILPVPYDRTSTWLKGADKGPLALIEASPVLEMYDIETDQEVYRNGIYVSPPLITDAAPEEMAAAVEAKTAGLIDAGKFVVTLGGEHSISIGAVSAHAARFKNVSVLQLDAHADLRDEYEGSRYNHACVMTRIKEICPAVQVGIRSMCAEEKGRIDRENVFFAGDIASAGERGGWIEKAVGRLSDNVYVTIDVDVLDPSVMPSTGTPEPGGLTWYQVTGLLRAVAESRTVVGFDLVELCPNPSNKAPDYLAAKLVYKFLSYVFERGSRVK
ncbi:MAG: agmatinase [Candidatus Omnitrophota bacterium]